MAASEREEAAGILIRAFLRPQEALRSVVEAREYVTNRSDASSRRMSSGASTVRSRVLAVVSNDEAGVEEGCIFVFKVVVTWNELRQPNSRLILLSIFLLDGDLELSVAQYRHQDVREIQQPSKFQTPSPTLMSFTVKVDGQTSSYIAPSSESLRLFISECRRYKKLDEVSVVPRFQWVSHYKPARSSRRMLPPLYPRPDLRTLLKPGHEHLSPAFAGQPGDEELDATLIRDEWLRNKLDECEDEYSSSRSLRIRIGTFNVNGKTPSQDLSPWVRPYHSSKSKHTRTSSIPPLKAISPLEVRLEELELNTKNPSDVHNEQKWRKHTKFDDVFEAKEPDMLVFGFQELDLSAEALLYSYTTSREEMWLEAIFAGLGEVRDQYTKLASKQLVGMLLILIVRKALVPDFSDVKVCAVGRGIMGLMGNKGATGIRLIFRSTVLSFVNSHLAAYDEFTERRNADFHDLSRRMVFDVAMPGAGNIDGGQNGNGANETSGQSRDIRASLESTAEGGVYGLGGGVEGPENVYQSDFLFWMVHLNYRIDLPDLDIREMIATEPKERNIRELLEHDQLVKAMAAGNAFEGFKEGNITQVPSYRFNSEMASDTLGYDMKRRPAWTDRILYMTSHPDKLLQVSYSTHLEIAMSDHRPVSAEFDVQVRKVDNSEYDRHALDLVHRLGDFENSEEVPRLKMEETTVAFGDVRYRQKVVRNVGLTNVGKIPVAYRLVGKSEYDLLPSWLTVTPQMGIVLPGQREVLTLVVYISDSIATELNMSSTQLDDILILHTERGKDHFVTVTGTYMPTCFANDLSLLVRLPGPIRDVKNRNGIADEHLANAPREVMRLINWLMSAASDEIDHLPFLQRGDEGLFQYICECLDTGEEFDFDKSFDRSKIVHSIGDVLIQFLGSLPTPIIPPSFHGRCELAADQNEAFEVVSELPGPSLNVWISLTAYLHYIARLVKSPKSESDVSLANLFASIFAPVLLRGASGGASQISPLAKRRFILLFIQ